MEGFWGEGESVGAGTVLDLPSLLQQERAQPAVLALLILDEVLRLRRLRRVHLHHVVVHERRAPEERETARTAQHAAKHVLCRLLQPVAHGVLELLVPHHGAVADGVDPAAHRRHLPVLLHPVQQQANGIRSEVHVTVQRHDEDVVRLGEGHQHGYLPVVCLWRSHDHDYLPVVCFWYSMIYQSSAYGTVVITVIYKSSAYGTAMLTVMYKSLLITQSWSLLMVQSWSRLFTSRLLMTVMTTVIYQLSAYGTSAYVCLWNSHDHKYLPFVCLWDSHEHCYYECYWSLLYGAVIYQRSVYGTVISRAIFKSAASHEHADYPVSIFSSTGNLQQTLVFRSQELCHPHLAVHCLCATHQHCRLHPAQMEMYTPTLPPPSRSDGNVHTYTAASIPLRWKCRQCSHER